MILDLVGKVLGTVAKVVGLDSVTGAVSTIKGAIEQNESLQLELRKIEIEEKKLLLEEAQSLHGLYATEIKSDDKFVRRARPAMIWLSLTLLCINFGLIPLFNSLATYCGWAPVVITIPDLPEPLYYLIGTMFTVYTGARSWDKYGKKG
jgi:hypothetical protein